MDGYSVYGATGMPRGSLLLIEHGRGMQIEPVRRALALGGA